MLFTDMQQLPCLESTDYAAYALYMQCLAEQLDSQLTQQLTELEFFTDRPTGYWTAGATQTISAGGNVAIFDISGPSGSAGWTRPFPPFPQLDNVRGWWFIGCTVNVVATGVVTASSQRLMNIDYTPPVDAGPSFPLVRRSKLTYESNTGNGENLSIAAVVYSPGSLDNTPTSDGGSFLATMNHNNGSSLTTTLTPASRYWATFLGDTPAVGS